ncbi:alpha/beta hydrolase [Actinacidiphila bryophytorum]|uniref:alpha/beta hydrolase n=1 Tax=Actinacidiphila bryophytorum TaxID=1436133 RepID=UPI002176B277|nr:alpha/beta hydrolase [Actinacidiphila bryophytorum]UWE07520.1 alpha/beta hydrolase [Actinacidiphila bryophytorum]
MAPPPDLLTQLRDGARERRLSRPRGPEMAAVEDLTGPGGIPLRRYRPGGDGLPLLVFLHGGGFVFCDLDTHDRTCRRIAAACALDVLAVDYRLAPEHPHPAALDDAVAVLQWARPAAVAGDSAGGFLAAAACLALRDAGGPLPGLQALICPNTDLTLSRPSITEKGTGHGLDADILAFFVASYVPDPAARAAASPLHAPDLAGLPPALVVTAEHDALRDEGEDYAGRLAAAGVPVRRRREAGLPHGFIQGMDLTDPAAAAAHDRVFADLRDLVPRH